MGTAMPIRHPEIILADKGISFEPEAGDLILEYIRQLEIDCVFGVPGGAIEPLYNALARSEVQGGPRPIVARHESGAAFMADGYARETGKLGVCCATTGPGATNLITGVASAFQDNIPMLVITAQSPLSTFERGAVQESSCSAVDTASIFRHCTRYSSLVSHPDQLERKLVTAIKLALQPPKGPTHLTIPLDLLRAKVLTDTPAYDVRSFAEESPMVDLDAVGRLLQKIADAQRVVFLVGDGCGNAAPAVLKLAEGVGATILATPQGKGLVDPYHPLYGGVFGLAGHESANSALADRAVDLVVAFGTNFDEIATRCWDEELLLTSRLVHVDSVARNFTRSPMAQLHVEGNISATVLALLAQLRRNKKPFQALQRSAEIAANNGNTVAEISGGKQLQVLCRTVENPTVCLDESTPIKPQRLIYELSSRFPSGTRFLADIGNSFLWATHYLTPPPEYFRAGAPKNGGFVRTSMGFSSMGWAIGGAVGTAVGAPGCPVVCLVGDGSFLMNGQELTVAVAEGLPIIYVVLNDSALGTVKHGQRMAGAEQVGFELPPVDFSLMAQAMGADGHRIDSPLDFVRLDIDGICKRRGPTVLDIQVDPEEAPPLKARMKALHSS